MKTFFGSFIVFLVMLLLPSSTMAQDVNIIVPINNIINKTDFISVQTVMNTQGNRWWQWDYLPRGSVYPTVKATRDAKFTHTTNPSIHLPASVLQWRLASIGGQVPPFMSGDVWPGFKTFTTSDQTWFEPFVWNEQFSPGNIDFTFKIPASAFINHSFPSGKYAMEIIQNYGVPMPNNNGVTFSPHSFYIYIIIPENLYWISPNNSSYTEVNSLNSYRSTSRFQVNLGTFELSHTVDFKLFAKSASANIQFTSSKGVQRTRKTSMFNLGGNNPKITTSPLTANWKDLTQGTSFKFESGNRNEFELNLSVSNSDFKNYFFEAGTYKFQINLNAKSTDNTTSSQENIDFTLKVLPLSEITIPASGSAVNFEFNTIAHYQNGQSKLIPNQIKISNNETFELYVKSDASFFKKGGIQTDVNSNILEIGIENGSAVALTTTPQKIISAGTPVLDQELNIKYTIPPTAAQSLVGKEKTIYSINVIYSFTAL